MKRLPGRPAALAAAATAALLAGGCAAGFGETDPGSEPVVIGVSLNLTGRGPMPGSVFHNALELQLAQVHERELAGARQLELRVLDNRGDPGSAAANLAELADDPEVAAIITAGCPGCVIEAAGQLDVPVVSLDGEAAVASPAAERRWVFRLGPNAGDNADALSQAMARAGAETFGIVAVDDPYGDEGLAAVADAARRDDLRLITEQRVALGDEEGVAAAAEAIAGAQPSAGGPDNGTTPPPPVPPEEAEEAEDGEPEQDPQQTEGPGDPAAPDAPDAIPADEPPEGPDAVVLWTYAPLAADAAAALREAGYQGDIFVDMVGADELFLAGTATALEGATLVFSATAVADQRIASSPALAIRQAWLQQYLASHGTYHLHSSWAADALLVLADAIARAGHPDRAAIRDRLESTRVDGVTGQIRFTGDQHSGLSPSALVTLRASGDRWQ